ncbi:TonB-dependent receptor domain-containing protein [Coralloluteibacterium thermophilus]|uniref:TonB-dependent receptor domain-containing protein n=1 Tax=Coralloluteibacterium thermophilum TaxID=2707049 RepID=A0ABV9NMG7_9GAMM
MTSSAARPGPLRSTLFLAITGLLAAPGALAQTAQDAASTAPQSSSSARALDAVTVRGEYIPEPMAQTSEIASFVTREDFQRTGDSDAAQALTRVTGLSLAQGRFVYVRGLGERYSSALLNGSALPSPEPLQRVVPLDLFPSSVLDSITVQKTYSVRYPGEFGGGVIDLQTITVPDEPFFNLSVGTGGNTETTGKRGLTHYGGGDDFWGYDNGTRKMPRELRDAIATGNRVDGAFFSQQELARIGRSFVNAPLTLLQETDSVDPDVSFGGSAGYSADMGSFRMGFIAVAGFENKWNTRNGVQQEGANINDVLEVRTDYDFRSTQNDAKVNVLLGTGLDWGQHKVNLTTIYVHDTIKETRSREGFDELFGEFVRDDYTEWFERDMVNNQIAGSHSFGEYDDLTIEWRGSFSKARRQAPYERGIRYRLVDTGTEQYYVHSASREQNYTRFSTVDDKVVSGGVDVTWRLPVEREAILSGGLSYSDNDRSAESREFRFLALNGPLPELVQRQRVDFLLSDYNISQGYLTLRETTGSSGAAAYDATLKVKGAYLQAEAEIVPALRGTVGVRYEDATQAVRPYNLFSAAVPQAAPPLANDYFLPAGTLTWNFAENQQVRVGASKTIGRPQFRELAPQQYLDTDSDRLFIGNPYLFDTEIRNYDARYEFFFDQGGSFTAALFYKDLDRPIESIVNEAGGTIQQTFINVPRAELYGAEVDFRRYFDLPIQADWWGQKRLYVGGNYTYTKSEVKAKAGDVVYPLGFNGQPVDALQFVRVGSAMQGQSQDIANVQIGIEDEASRSQLTLAATYVGERISARGRPGQPDFVQRPGTMLDLIARKGIDFGGTEVTVSFEARNLLGTEYQEYQELGGGRVDINRYDLGRSFSINLSAAF